MEDDLTYSDSSEDIKLIGDELPIVLRTLLLLDFGRMSHSEEWYNMLPHGGTQFVFFLNKGIQFSFVDPPTLSNVGQTHWHFHMVTIHTIDALNELKNKGIRMYTANFGCFLRGLEKLTNNTNRRRYKGFNTLKRTVGERNIFAKHDDLLARIELYRRIQEEETPFVAEKIDGLIDELIELLYLREQKTYVENMYLLQPF